MLETMPHDPILEAIFDIRFNTSNTAFSSILLGTFSTKSYKNRFSRTERLPINDLPIGLRQTDPNLRFQPEFRLHGENEVLLIGSHNLAIAVQKPYIGWKSFKEKILGILSEVENLGENLEVIRAAFRYVNMIESKDPLSFDAIQFSGNVGKFNLNEQNTLIKLELGESDVNHSITIKNNASAQMTGQQKSAVGLLLDIDTSTVKNLDTFWKDKAEFVENLRVHERNIFESIISEDSLAEYRKND